MLCGEAARFIYYRLLSIKMMFLLWACPLSVIFKASKFCPHLVGDIKFINKKKKRKHGSSQIPTRTIFQLINKRNKKKNRFILQRTNKNKKNKILPFFLENMVVRVLKRDLNVFNLFFFRLLIILKRLLVSSEIELKSPLR